MITEQTTFILGAGASVPFGFPTGEQLRAEICRENHYERENTKGEKHWKLFTLLQKCGQSDDSIEQFCYEFERSGVISIDTFIAFRPEFQELGELSIAGILLPLECNYQLYRRGRLHGNADWYQLVWNELLVGVTKPAELIANTVNFVTFNYDRSLEHFLHGAISATFGLAPQEAHEILGQLRIHHVYGSLGPYCEHATLPYGGYDEAALIAAMKAARESIKTVPTRRGPADEISASWLANAQRVFVLGFGFDATNCDRIGLKNACALAAKQQTPKQVFASAYNLTAAEIKRNERNSCNHGQGGLIWTNGDCMALLRARKDLLL